MYSQAKIVVSLIMLISFGVPSFSENAVHLQVEIEVFGTQIRYFCCQSQGVDWVFVSHTSFKRIGLYGDAFGPFQDNQVGVWGASLLTQWLDTWMGFKARERTCSCSFWAIQGESMLHHSPGSLCLAVVSDSDVWL